MLRDHCVGIGHHGDEEIQEDNYVDHAVRSEHKKSPETRVRLDPRQFKVLQAHHSETGPEERLRGFKETVQEDD